MTSFLTLESTRCIHQWSAQQVRRVATDRLNATTRHAQCPLASVAGDCDPKGSTDLAGSERSCSLPVRSGEPCAQPTDVYPFGHPLPFHLLHQQQQKRNFLP